ncbi:MAG TPA: TIM-barrel domain-containing protein [Mucilaginibacter sp.]|nr:TIM-barrel domain-containing protein [Mucilaginibacter sp.]
MKRILYISLLVLGSSVAVAQNNNLIWKEVVPGVWSVKVGTPDKVNFLTASGAKPRKEAISNMPAVSFPLDKSEITAEIHNGKTYLKFPLDRQEKIFGLGLNFKRTQIRGFAYRLHVNHYNGVDDGTTHAPVPFYVSSKGYGVFINAARYIDVWVGTSVHLDSKDQPAAVDRNTDRKNWSTVPYADNVEMLIPAAGVELYVFGGPTIMDAVCRYNLFQGGGFLPPKWGLGFWHRTPSLYTQNQVEKEVADFEKHDIPLSVIGLEPGWQSKAYPCSYVWDAGRFPEPGKFVNSMTGLGVKVNLWMHGWVSPQSPLYQPLMPLSGSHTVWRGLAPDFTLPAATSLIKDYFNKEHLSLGVSGYKMDENDGNVNEGWYFPDVAKFPSGTDGDQMHQMYGMLMQKFTTDMFREKNQRTYGLVRASNAGAASFPYVLYDDYYSHPDFITALINSSFSGILWTPEARSSATSEEWVRRIQVVCFSPLAMLNAWSSGTKPWSFPDVEKQVADVIKLRMQLIPYFYTAFADYAFKGKPPVRSLNFLPEFTPYEQPTQPKQTEFNTAVNKDMKNQFMVGDNLMVCPIFTGEKERKIILPKGKWYDFYTGDYAGDGEVITITPSLDRIPLYVKDGGIIPMIPAKNHLGDERLPVEVRYYGTKPAAYTLYDDDGTTYNYEKGNYSRVLLQVTKDKSGKLKQSVIIPGKVWSYTTFKWHIMTKNN